MRCLLLKKHFQGYKAKNIDVQHLDIISKGVGLTFGPAQSVCFILRDFIFSFAMLSWKFNIYKPRLDFVRRSRPAGIHPPSHIERPNDLALCMMGSDGLCKKKS